MQKIKKVGLIALIAISVLQAAAQKTADTSGCSSMWEAMKYYKGTATQLVDYKKYFQLLQPCAEAGSAKAMYKLAECYLKGTGTALDVKKAEYWYRQAGQKKYPKAYHRLGYAYKKGLMGQPDYEKAYTAFCDAAAMNYKESIFMKAYMLYTGLGCSQDYAAAYPLFQQSAAKGYPHAMRFIGLSMRNGYGTAVNKDSAVFWMQRASKLGNGMSDDELAAPEPENADLVGTLVDKVKAAQKLIKRGNPINTYTKIAHSLPANEIEGRYEGWLLKYDWSGQHVVKADKLTIELRYDNDSLKGLWTENDSLSLPVRAMLTRTALLFNGMEYNKHDHYYKKIAEQLRFDKAGLQLIKDKDSTYLCGNLQLYSVYRKEPAKPMYVALVRTAKGSSNHLINYVNEDGSPILIKNLNAYPNPFSNLINLDFELKKSCPVQTKIFTLDGKEVYSNAAKQLEAGSYSIPIQPQHLAAGTYLLELTAGTKATTVKVEKIN